MKLGLGSYAYRWSIGKATHQPETPLTPSGLVEKAADFGLDVLQIADNLPLHKVSEQEHRNLKAALKQHHVALELGTDGLAQLETYLELATTYDAALVRLTLNQDDLDTSREDLLHSLDRFAHAFAERHKTIALENHFLLRSQELADIINTVGNPALGVCLDVANSIASKEWSETTIRTLAPLAVNVHLKDYRIALDPDGVGFAITGTPLGEGETDIPFVFRALEDAGRDVNVILEHWLPYALVEEHSYAVEDDWTERSVMAARAFIPRVSNPKAA